MNGRHRTHLYVDVVDGVGVRLDRLLLEVPHGWGRSPVHNKQMTTNSSIWFICLFFFFFMLPPCFELKEALDLGGSLDCE